MKQDLRFKLIIKDGNPVFVPMFIKKPTYICDCNIPYCGISLNEKN